MPVAAAADRETSLPRKSGSELPHYKERSTGRKTRHDTDAGEKVRD
jgi:hypothetical protein